MDINVTISDTDVKALQDGVVDIDVWIQAAVIGKISNCKKRMIAEWQPKLFSDPEVDSIPADETAFINMVVARDDYKNLLQKQEEWVDR